MHIGQKKNTPKRCCIVLTNLKKESYMLLKEAASNSDEEYCEICKGGDWER